MPRSTRSHKSYEKLAVLKIPRNIFQKTNWIDLEMFSKTSWTSSVFRLVIFATICEFRSCKAAAAGTSRASCTLWIPSASAGLPTLKAISRKVQLAPVAAEVFLRADSWILGCPKMWKCSYIMKITCSYGKTKPWREIGVIRVSWTVGLPNRYKDWRSSPTRRSTS